MLGISRGKRKRSLDSAERKISFIQSCIRECNRSRIASFGKRIQFRTAWVSEFQYGRCFIECFTCSVIDCCANQLRFQWRAHKKQARMSTRCDKSNRRPLKRNLIEQACDKMRHHMIDSNERNVERPCECFRCACSNKQRSDQSRAMTRGDTGDFIHRDAGIGARASNDGDDSVQVCTTGDFRNNPPIFRM